MNHPCVRQTDGQMDGIAIAYARLAYMLSRAKTELVGAYVRNPAYSLNQTRDRHDLPTANNQPTSQPK